MIENRGPLAALWGSLPSGKTVTITLACAAVAWDLLCKPEDTVSAVLGGWLYDPKTRGPLLGVAGVLAAHLVLIAVRTPPPEEPRADLHLERFEVLRAIGFPA
jgi:hypothetical protein